MTSQQEVEGVSAGMAKLKLFVDCPSPPSRALVIFCRAADIKAEEVKIDIMGHQTRTPEFKKLNPLGLLPCIDDGGFHLFESHAILRYLATTRHVADHWYPKDPQKRALIDAALDWHHLGLRKHSAQLMQNAVYIKLPPMKHGFYPELDNREAMAVEAANALQTSALDQLESIFLQQDGKFLQGAEEVSLADLSLACEIKQMELLDSELCKKLLGSRKRIATWMADVEAALHPHFADGHKEFFEVCMYVDSLRAKGDI